MKQLSDYLFHLLQHLVRERRNSLLRDNSLQKGGDFSVSDSNSDTPRDLVVLPAAC